MGQQVLPFYLVCDESRSMEGDNIEAVNRALPELHRRIGSDPVVADKAHLAIIGFSNDAQVILKLSDLSKVTQVPKLKAKGGTSFGAAFRMLSQQIAFDVERLKTADDKVFRPVVFFISDGYPTDDGQWQQDLASLVAPDNRYRPQMFAYGVSDADAQLLEEVAPGKVHLQDADITPAQALVKFIQDLTNTIVSTVQGDAGADIVIEEIV